ncbi:PheS-related mystery ligase SrmL [Kaarinaea lacus]
MPNLLSTQVLSDTLKLVDLTNPRHGSHAMQIIIRDIHRALADQWQCRRQLVRTSPVVPIENNYDRLGYPEDGAAREARYTRYVTEQLILRTQTSATVPDILDGLTLDPPENLLLILPGMVYRRDSIDRLHCGEPHQLDLWRIVDNRKAPPMTTQDLEQMIAIVMGAALPGIAWRIHDSPHPYTDQGVQIDALWHQNWIEVGECGLAARSILNNAGLNNHSGLAMGLGLDRLLMLRKNIPDIRLLRSQDTRIRQQMDDLQPYQPVSAMPAIRRDLSLCVDQSMTEEEIGDIVRSGLSDPDCVETLVIKSETPYDELPPSAHDRMGMLPGQKNVLLQVVIRHMDRTLTDEEGNTIRNAIYKLLHQGEKQELATN